MYDLLLTSVIAAWGLNYVFLKVGLRELDAGVFTLVRFLGATPFIFALLRFSGEDWRLPRADWMRAALTGLVGTALYQTLFAAALRYTTAANVSLLLALSPTWTALMGWLSGRDRVSRLTLVGIAVAFCGAAVVIATGPAAQLGFSLGTLKGDLIGLLVGLLWAAYAVLAQPLLARYSGTKVTAYAALFGGIPLLLLYGPAALAVPWTELSAATWGSVLYSILAVTVFALVAFYHCIARLGPTRVMSYMYLQPAAAIGAAALLLGERITWPQVAGGLLALAGIWLVRRGSRPPTAAPGAAAKAS